MLFVLNVCLHVRHLCRILKPGDKLHVVWVTTEGGDFDNAALQSYKDAMEAAKVRAGCRVCILVLCTVSHASDRLLCDVYHPEAQNVK